MEYEQLMISDTLTKPEMEFKQLHYEILTKGNMAAECVTDMCTSLKKMRDNDLFKVAGFASFEEYAEKALNLKRRQAYNYISIASKLSEEFIQSNAQLGVSKLALIASMSEHDREELIEEHGEELKDLTVNEIEQIKAEYEERIKQIQMQFDEELSEYKADVDTAKKIDDSVDKHLEEENEKLKQQLENAKKIDKDLDAFKENEVTRLLKEKKELEKELDLVKKAAPKVIEDTKSKKELEKLKMDIAALSEVKKVADEKAKKVADDAKAEVEKLKADIASKQAEIEKQGKLSDSNVVKFKTLYDVAKVTFEKLLEHVNALQVGEQQSKFINIISKFCDNIKSTVVEVKHE